MPSNLIKNAQTVNGLKIPVSIASSFNRVLLSLSSPSVGAPPAGRGFFISEVRAV